MRDLSPPVPVVLDGQEFALRLDMTSLFDFEQEADMTVAEFVKPLVGVMQKLLDETGAESMEELQALSAEERGAVGLRMLDEVLDSGVLSAKKLLVLVWAAAGGTDTGLTPREFGRLVNWANRGEIAAAVMGAVRTGLPEAEPGDDQEEPVEDAADEDPTPGLALSTTGQ